MVVLRCSTLGCCSSSGRMTPFPLLRLALVRRFLLLPIPSASSTDIIMSVWPAARSVRRRAARTAAQQGARELTHYMRTTLLQRKVDNHHTMPFPGPAATKVGACDMCCCCIVW